MAIGRCDGQYSATQSISAPQTAMMIGWMISIGEYSLVPNWSPGLISTCSFRLPGNAISSCVSSHVHMVMPRKYAM